MELSDIAVEVRDLNLNMVGKIPNEVLDFKGVTHHCGVGQWTIRLPKEHRLAQELMKPGYGIRVQINTKNGWQTYLSGPNVAPTNKRTSADPEGIITITGVTDEILLWDTLAWGDPLHALDAQATANDVRTGIAETVMKQYVDYNLGPGALSSRRGALALNLVIEPNEARGITVKKSPRFQVLGDLLVEIATYSHLGFKLRQVDNTLRFMVYVPQDKTSYVRFNIDNGNLVEETTAIQAPSVTRTIVAGQGEGIERTLIQRTTSDSLAAEVDWGRKIETWIDQRQTDDLAELQQAGDEPLIASGFTGVSVTAVPNEVQSMKYWDDWGLGDMLGITINGLEASAQATSVSMVANSGGVEIGAALGDVTGFKASTALQSQLNTTISRVDSLERNASISKNGLFLASFTQYDDTTLPSSWDNGLTIGNTGNDSGWPATYANLRVFKAGNDARVVQEVTKTGGGDLPTVTWVRSSISASSWGPWRVVQAQTNWLTTGLTYGNGITSYSSYPIEYMRDGNWVVMRGLVQRASGWAAGATYTAGITLPTGYRIQRDDFFAVPAAGADAYNMRVKVNTGGTIDFRVTPGNPITGGYYSLNNIRFWSPI